MNLPILVNNVSVADNAQVFTPDASLWASLRAEAGEAATQDLIISAYMRRIQSYGTLAEALAQRLSDKLSEPDFLPIQIEALFLVSYRQHPEIIIAAEKDLRAIVERDPATGGKLLAPFLFFKGFQALQAYRVAHSLWLQQRHMLALLLQSRIAAVYNIDIHPAAQIGSGIMMDHAHGIVIGETTVIEDNVSLLHNVTLGGTGKEGGDRHPKIRSGVMIGAGAKILGNIEIGACARIAAGSVVLENVPPCVTVAGVPARIIGKSGCAQPSAEMDQLLYIETGENTVDQAPDAGRAIEQI
jgi:serine O-acetyltransferase